MYKRQPSHDRAEQVSVTTEVLTTYRTPSERAACVHRQAFTGWRQRRWYVAECQPNPRCAEDLSAILHAAQYSTRGAARAGTTPVGENVTALEP